MPKIKTRIKNKELQDSITKNTKDILTQRREGAKKKFSHSSCFAAKRRFAE